MELEKIKWNSKKVIKILTIAIYIITLLIYEIGICNIQALKEHLYNFSLCRIVLYVIFFILLLKNIDKFLFDAIETLQSKTKKIIIGIYFPIMIGTIIYTILKWTSIYKALTLAIALLMGLLFIIYVSANYVKDAIILISTLGIVFTFATDFHHTLDEKKHIMSALNMAGGNFNYIKNPLAEPEYNNIIFNCDIDSFAQFYSKKYESNLTNEWNITEETEIYYICSSPAEYNFVVYIPSALGITFAKVLGGSVADAYITGRLFNLIAYGAMLVAILKLLPYKRKIFYVIDTLPLVVLLAASYSIDGMCIGLIGMYIAYCLKLSGMDYKEIKLKQILLLILLFAGCLIAKDLSYFAMIILVLILPIFKILKNNKKRLPIIIPVIIAAMIVCILLMLGKFGSTSNAGGDPRGGETSVSGQIAFLLSSPANIVKVGFEHIMNSILDYNWCKYWNETCFFGKYSSQIFMLEMIFIIYVCCTDNSKKIGLRTSIWSIATFIGVFASTSLMLYLTFTPVGQIEITGYQPRYLLPILPLVLMLINNKRYIGKTEKKEEENTDIMIVLGSGLFILIDLICLIYVI